MAPAVKASNAVNADYQLLYIIHCVSKTSPTFLTISWKPIVRFW